MMSRKYAGGMDLMSFWREYQDIIAINSWSEETSRRMFPLQLKKAARLFYDELRASLEEEGERMENVPLQTVVNHLRTKFITESALDRAMTGLKRCKQKKDEMLFDFEARFKDEAKKAGVADGPSLAYRFFRNVRLQNLPLKSFRSVAEVTQFAKEYEDGEIARGTKRRKVEREDSSSDTDSSSSQSDSSAEKRSKKRPRVEIKQVSALEADPKLSELKEILVEVKQILRARPDQHQVTISSPRDPVSHQQPLVACQICGKHGHIAPQCFSLGANRVPVGGFQRRGRGGNRGTGRGRGSQQDVRCYTCNQLGHMAYQCTLHQQQSANVYQATRNRPFNQSYEVAPAPNGLGN